MNKLEKYYNDPKFPGSFSSPRTFYNEVKKIDSTIRFKTVKEFLQSQNAYTLHRQTRKPKKYRRVYTHYPNYLWQTDLLFYDKHAKENKGYKYLLCTIDTFSKVLYVFPMKTKSGQEAVIILDKLFRKQKPLFLQADRGSEFVNHKVRDLLKKRNIKFYSSNSPLKASIIERAQLTLRQRLTKLFTKQGSYNWIDNIDNIVESYNNTVHSSIGIPPNDVTIKNTPDVLKRLYPDLKKKYYVKKYKRGDQVRVQKDRMIFDKASAVKGWTEEIFSINRILNTMPVTYEINDYTGDTIKGSFYASELQRVKEDLFHIAKVIKTKIVRGKKKFLVKFVGYPDNYWVDDIQSLK